MTEGIPLGAVILIVLAVIILLLTPGGRGLLWPRWGMVEPKARSRTQAHRGESARLGRPFGHRGEFNGFS
jgi:hypothetical protein